MNTRRVDGLTACEDALHDPAAPVDPRVADGRVGGGGGRPPRLEPVTGDADQLGPQTAADLACERGSCERQRPRAPGDKRLATG